MSMLDLDDAAFQREPITPCPIREIRHAVHESMGLWPFRFIKGVHNAPPAKPFRRIFDFYCLAHMYEGRGYFWLPGRGVRPVAPGDCILMPPGQLHSYGGLGELFIEDAICFTGPVADCLLANNLIRCGLFPLGQERKLLPAMTLALDPAPASQAKAALALENLLLEIVGGASPSESTASGDIMMAKLLQALRLDPEKWWTVKEMAAFCALSVAQFRRRFTEAVGMPPKQYVESLKMRCAAEVLARGEMTVAEVARRHSYRDPYHFSRRFKALMGMPPNRMAKKPLGG